MMHMTFYWGRQATILFPGWITKTWLDYGLSLVALFLASLFHEYVVSRRILFMQAHKARGAASSNRKGPQEPLLGSSGSQQEYPAWSFKVMESLLFAINTGLGFLLMLAAMSFNAGVFLSIVAGLAVGYFVFRAGGSELGKPEQVQEACESSCCT